MKRSATPAWQWLSVGQIARLELPGMPRSKRAVHAQPVAEQWASRTAEDGRPLSRPRRARGGGLEYHIDLLPDDARQLVIAQGEAEAQVASSGQVADAALVEAWQWFTRQPSSVKVKARLRLLVLNSVERSVDIGASKQIAIRVAAETHKVSPRAIADWFTWTANVEPRNRLPFLASGMPGRGKAQRLVEEIKGRRLAATERARAAFMRLHPDDRRNLLMDLFSLEMRS